MLRATNRQHPHAAIAAMILAVAGLASHEGFAQDSPPPPAASPESIDAPIDPLVAYLSERGLDSVLAAHLRKRLSESVGPERADAAEQLGKLYVRQLAVEGDSERRKALEARSRELLQQVPDSESFELRIALAKATYLQAEEIAERRQLRVATDEDIAEATRVIRATQPVFEDIAGKLRRKVDPLEKREALARDADLEAIRQELSEARRLRSLAAYYAGWAAYYNSLLTGETAQAGRALEYFGVVLNAIPGRGASIERVPKDTLRYDHVARSAVGCALATNALRRDVESLRWLQLLDECDELPPAVQKQLLSRKLMIFASNNRWSDIEVLLKRSRTGEDGVVVPLDVPTARLAAVLALEAAQSESTREGLKPTIDAVAQIALGDLVAKGEVGHVLDLVSRYGTAPISTQGFVVLYVRGLQSFERARTAHRELASKLNISPDEPTTQTDILTLYRDATEILSSACQSPDSATFPNELSRARVQRGLSLFYSNNFDGAADEFERAFQDASAEVPKRDALWYAIVTLDRSVENGRSDQTARRDRLATLYLKTFPGSENATKLLLRQTRAEGVSENEAIDILLKVPSESPLYEAARRQASRMLYQAVRRTSGTEKEFIAIRFLDIAREVLRLEQARALAGKDQTNAEAAQAAILRARQVLEGICSLQSPDQDRAKEAFDSIDTVANFHGIDIKSLGPELTFRKLQLAIARADTQQTIRHSDELRAQGGPFALSATRLLFKRAVDLWKRDGESISAAQEVVRSGSALIGVLNASQPSDPSQLAIAREQVAAAATLLARVQSDTAMRDLAISTDQAQLQSGQRTASALRRLARALEGTQRKSEALSAWEELVSGLPVGQDDWYEARYESLRLLVELKPSDGAAALRQHRVLFPADGPEPWGTKIRELAKQHNIDLSTTPTSSPSSGGPR